MSVSPRLAAKIEEIFPAESESVIASLDEVDEKLFRGEAGDRLLAAMIIYSEGRIEGFSLALEEVSEDWRDVLVGAGLDEDDWPEKLEEFLVS